MAASDDPMGHTRPATDLSVATCGVAERAEQAALYDRCFGSDEGQQVLPWRYDASPHGQTLSLLARTAAGQAVSGYACSPRRILAQGEVVGTVGQTGDVMTDPEHRGQGIFSDLDRRAMSEAAERGWAFVFGLPNRQSASIFVEHLGWQSVGRIRPFTFVLHADDAARAERMKAGRLAAMATSWRAWRGNMRRGHLRDVAFDTLTSVALPRFDESVEPLVRQVAADWPWMVERDAAYLNWRFIDAPSGRFRAHGVFDEGGGLQAYVVVQLPGPGEFVGHVVDLVARDPVAWAGAMEAALGHLAKLGASVARAHAIEGSDWEKRLRWAGFARSSAADYKIVIVHALDEGHPLSAVAGDPASWFFTDGDRDDELVH
jgi:predicted N-acetyltransferase YhbS